MSEPRSRRARVLRRLRASRAASAARRVVTGSRRATRRVSAADHFVGRTRERARLAARAAPRHRGSVAAHQAVVATAARLPVRQRADTADQNVSVVLIIEGAAGSIPSRAELGQPAEVIVVLQGAGSRAPAFATTVVPARTGASSAEAAARAAKHAHGDLLCFLLASSEQLDASLLSRLVAALGGDTVAATPVTVHPVRPRTRATPYDGRVRAAGVELAVEPATGAPTENDVPILIALQAGDTADLTHAPAPVAGASAACLLVERAAYDAVGGLDEYADLDVAVFELCRRLRARGGSVALVPSAVVVDHRPVASVEALDRPVPAASAAWRALVDDAGPAMLREAAPLAPSKLRIAITIAAPNRKIASRWGDWHFAEAFADSLRRRGNVVRIQTADHADDAAGRACDVHCVVRGLVPVRRTPGQRHVLWIISHPETIRDAELDEADLVLVASTRFADALRSRTSTPVEVMLQATDPERFRPLPTDPEHRHDVTVVAKSRDEFRSSVADAIATGIRPAIYGSGWERFVDPALIVSDYVDNADLARVYSSAGVVLNDHWDTMREWGFVSNRIFDALACGAPVISDDVAEVSDLFDRAVPTFRDATDLRRLVDHALEDRDGARAEARRGMAIVLAHHTFDRRAEEFLDALARYRLDLPLAGTETTPPA